MGFPSFQFSDIPIRFNIRINFLSLTNDTRSSNYRGMLANLKTHLQVRKINVFEHSARFFSKVIVLLYMILQKLMIWPFLEEHLIRIQGHEGMKISYNSFSPLAKCMGQIKADFFMIVK